MFQEGRAGRVRGFSAASCLGDRLLLFTHLPTLTFLEKLSEKSGSLRVEASEGDQTSRKSSDSLLGNPKMEAPGATLDPFQTVSEGVFSETQHSPGRIDL
jgi:hypothetical protein